MVFLGGCNFRCPYCHNYTLVLRPEEIPSIPLDHILSRLAAFRDWIDGVVITGGEPTIHRTLPELVQAFRGEGCRLKAEGFKVKLHTNGSHPALLRALLEARLLDCVAMDLKAPLVAEKYHRAAGMEVNLTALRESLKLLLESPIPSEFRTTVVPSLQSPEDIISMAQEIEGSERLVLQGFNPRDPLVPNMQTELLYSLKELEEMAVEARRYVKSCCVIE